MFNYTHISTLCSEKIKFNYRVVDEKITFKLQKCNLKKYHERNLGNKMLPSRRNGCLCWWIIMKKKVYKLQVKERFRERFSDRNALTSSTISMNVRKYSENTTNFNKGNSGHLFNSQNIRPVTLITLVMLAL